MLSAQRAPHTLWEAAFLTRHETFMEWYKGLQKRIFKEQEPGYTQDSLSPATMHNIRADHRWKNKKKLQNVMTTFTVGIRPTPQQKVILDAMLRTSNQTFNWCKQLIVKNGINKFSLKKIVCKSQKPVSPHLRPPNDDWFLFGQGLSTKATVCEDFEAMKYSHIYKLKNKDGSFCPYTGSFKVKRECLIPYGQRKSRYGNYNKNTIHKEHIQYVCLLSNFSIDRTQNEPLLLRLSKPTYRLPPFENDVRIVKDPGGKYRLHIKCHASYTRKASKRHIKTAICGIDPGGHTFATIYDPSNKKCFQVGFTRKHGIVQKIRKYDESMLLFHQAAGKGQTEESGNRRRRLLKLKSKIDSSVKNLHVQLASMLVSEYRLVSLGKISLGLPRIRKDALYVPVEKNRDLYLWNHDRFRVLLKHRSLGENCHVVIQNEDWTSKTCGICGRRNHQLGKSDIFWCDRCFYQTSRDINGARNILRKSLGIFF